MVDLRLKRFRRKAAVANAARDRAEALNAVHRSIVYFVLSSPDVSVSPYIKQEVERRLREGRARAEQIHGGASLPVGARVTVPGNPTFRTDEVLTIREVHRDRGFNSPYPPAANSLPVYYVFDGGRGAWHSQVALAE